MEMQILWTKLNYNDKGTYVKCIGTSHKLSSLACMLTIQVQCIRVLRCCLLYVNYTFLPDEWIKMSPLSQFMFDIHGFTYMRDKSQSWHVVQCWSSHSFSSDVSIVTVCRFKACCCVQMQIEVSKDGLKLAGWKKNVDCSMATRDITKTAFGLNGSTWDFHDCVPNLILIKFSDNNIKLPSVGGDYLLCQQWNSTVPDPIVECKVCKRWLSKEKCYGWGFLKSILNVCHVEFPLPNKLIMLKCKSPAAMARMELQLQKSNSCLNLVRFHGHIWTERITNACDKNINLLCWPSHLEGWTLSLLMACIVTHVKVFSPLLPCKVVLVHCDS